MAPAYGCSSYNRPKSSLSTKVFSISRHVILAVVIIVTLAAFGYSIFIYVDCNDDVRGNDCAIGTGNVICSDCAYPMIALICTVLIMGTMLIRRSYYVCIHILSFSTLFEIIYLIIFALTENANALTSSSHEMVFREMQRCPLTSNASETSDSACWEMFRTQYCHGWILGENRVCQPFSYDCEFSINETGICYDDSFLQFYYNQTPYELVRDCVNSYEPWVVGAYKHHYGIAKGLFTSITVLHVALCLSLGFVVYMFKELKKDEARVALSHNRQVCDSYTAENSNSSSGVSSQGDRY